MQEVTGCVGLQTVLSGLRSRDPRERRLSARSFSALHVSDPLGALRPLLDDSDPNVRLAAVDALEDTFDERAVSMLLYMAANDESQDVRDAALHELAKYRSDRILKFLLSEVGRPQRSRRPRQLIAEQLRNYDAEASVDALLELARDADAYVQERAIESLFQLNRPRLRGFWALVEREWEGTYWGDLARRAIRCLRSSTEAGGRADRCAKDGPSWAVQESVRAQRERVETHSLPQSWRRSCTDGFVRRARRASGVEPVPCAPVDLSETLRRMTGRFVVGVWPLLYNAALERARDKLAQMESREPGTAQGRVRRLQSGEGRKASASSKRSRAV
ncbi:uncharacterized protein SOCEGT47_077560 [Sorangium cellulosum]|uniref:HEAT repeat domain-containing protein n=1 Tax=Sorangium cellulosum TaxID=56 RepID=A0A4P2QBW2_SORCE|nr:HEAT repeat domain-containing protein [Sorangium cellulosum]AUX27175.1 uncharacterized protein SOCEGT47_077560 [Sorangium cellulosum]